MNSKKIVTAIVLALLTLILLPASCSVIPPGNTGVLFNRLTGSLSTASQGAVWRIPLVTRVQSYPTALRTYTMVKRSGEGSSSEDDSIDLPTREGQHIRQDISVTFNTSDTHAADVFRSFRGADIEDIESTFIRRTIITAAQNSAGQMSLTEAISSKRDELQQSIALQLKEELGKMGFVLDKINLGASHLPPAIEQQMQQKMAVQQQAQQAEYELQKQQLLAKARVAEAEGQAKANQILQQTLTPQLIKNKAVEKWNGVLPHVTSGAIPFVSVKADE